MQRFCRTVCLASNTHAIGNLLACARCSTWHLYDDINIHDFTPNPSSSHLKLLKSSSTNRQLFSSIKQALNGESSLLKEMSRYQFDGLGKAMRPNVVLQTAQAINLDSGGRSGYALREQFVVAMIAEMIHTASLVHDDIIDASELRRGRPSVYSLWGQACATFTGDFIMATASVTLAQLRHNKVMQVISQILEDLVQGEFMQLGTKENEDERFNHYIEKSYRKTASLMANCCQAVALFSDATSNRSQTAFSYGKNLGIAFQLVDDLLDYVSNEKLMGKPTAADLKLGLATAPVLFAAQEFPQLNSLIIRRFACDGDVEQALDIVKKSSGGEQTRDLAQRYGQEAIKSISALKSSIHKDCLIDMIENKLYSELKKAFS